jgi:hypothetical protein
MANQYWQCDDCSATYSCHSDTTAASRVRGQSLCYVLGKRDRLEPSGKEFNQSTIIKYSMVSVPEHNITMFCLLSIHKARTPSECPSLLKCSCEIDTRYEKKLSQFLPKSCSIKVRFYQGVQKSFECDFQSNQLFRNWFPIKSKFPKLRLILNQNQIKLFVCPN